MHEDAVSSPPCVLLVVGEVGITAQHLSGCYGDKGKNILVFVSFCGLLMVLGLKCCLARSCCCMYCFCLFACLHYAAYVKAGSKNSTQAFISFLLFSSLLSFCFYLASFAYSFSRIVHYAPSIVNKICSAKS